MSNIEFFNLKKNRVPFLIDLKEDCYFNNLSTNSKRHYNKSNRIWKNKVDVSFSSFFEFNSDIINHFELNVNSIVKLKNSKNTVFLKISDQNKKIIAFNIYYITTHPTFKYIYSSCPWVYKKDHVLNNFLWFVTIEYFMKNNFDFLDLEYESDFRIENNKKYKYENIVDFQYILKNRSKKVGFGTENSSKFLFLTKNQKIKQNMNYLMTVCKCGQKNLIKTTVENECFNCKCKINKIYD